MSVKVQIVKSVLTPLNHDDALNRIAVVYADGKEYRVSAPAKASGPAIEWLDHATVRQPYRSSGYGGEEEVNAADAIQILKYVKEELEKQGPPQPAPARPQPAPALRPQAAPAFSATTKSAPAGSAVSDSITLLCFRFHEVVKQLRLRHNNRPTIEIQDEYDVQDLIHALLRIFFNDVRDEEWTPTYAGGASRMDFLVPEEETVLEVKKTRDGLSDKQIGEQLLIDIAKYQQHAKCKRLVCFVYDPDGRIRNPRGLESDLSKMHDKLRVEVFVVPR